MEHEHLDVAALERLLAVDRTEDMNRSLLHQIAVCPECRKVGGWLLDLYRAGALPSQFGPVEVALARSRTEAPALWARLKRHRSERRAALVRGTRSFASWGLAELLCRMSRESAPVDADQSVKLAELAVLVADAVEDDQPAEARWAYQLRALGWSCLGNARRVSGDLSAAEQASGMSESWWSAGVETIGDVLGYEPVLLDLKASLRTTQERFEEAIRDLDEAARIYLSGDPEHRDPHLAGRSLLKKAHALIEMGETERAIDALKEAAGLVQPEREPRLVYGLQHNLVDNLTKAGRFAEARPLLSGLWALVRAHGGRLDQLRVRWVEARIAAGLGERERAREGFLEVRQVFLDREMAYDAALASLELAVLSIEEGRIAEVKMLAAEMVAVFQAQQVEREALAAVMAFQKAAEMETASAGLAREVAATVGRAQTGSGFTRPTGQ